MDYGEAYLAPLTVTVEERLLLDYSVDTAKLMVRRVSHDFNNLIAVIRGYASLLQGRPGQDGDIKELAGLIEQASSELAALTERMAQFADSPGHERSWFNLNSVVTEFLKEGRSQVPQDIEVEIELGSLMPDLWGDPRLIGVLCQKLWQNAIDSMPHGGRLLLKTRTLDASTPDTDGAGVNGTANGDNGLEPSRNNGRGPTSYLLLRVTDTGEGMDEGTRASMFRPFFTTKSGKCRGLGATVVYEAVKFHGGRLYVSSELGKGTNVDIHLPVAGGTQAQPVGDGDEPVSQGPFLLVVDDDDMVRMTIQRMLAHLGYDTIPAASGEEALTIYESSRDVIFAVILDVTMPGLGGVETFHRLRAMDSQVKIIIASGDPRSPAVREIEGFGVSYVMAKPFHTEDLSRAVQSVLE